MKSAFDLIREDIGVITREVENPETASVGAVSVPILRENANRVFFVVINLSINVVNIRPGQAATAAIGIPLGSAGGLVSFNIKDDKTLPTKEWWGFAAAGASTIYVVELVISR